MKKTRADNQRRKENGNRFIRTAISAAVLSSVLSACGGGDVEFAAQSGTVELSNESNATILLTEFVIGEANTEYAFEIVSLPEHGILSFHTDSVIYVPDEDYEGTDSFEYLVVNEEGTEKSNFITLKITDATIENKTKVVRRAALRLEMATLYSTQSGISVPILAYTNNKTARIKITRSPNFGKIEQNANAFDYMPIEGFVGEDSFELTASNEFGESVSSNIVVKTHIYQDVISDTELENKTDAEKETTDITNNLTNDALLPAASQLFYLRSTAEDDAIYDWRQIDGPQAKVFQDGNGRALIQSEANKQELFFALFRIESGDEEIIETHTLTPDSNQATNPFTLNFAPFDAQLITTTQTQAFVFLADIGIISLDISPASQSVIRGVYHSDQFIEHLSLVGETLYTAGYGFIDMIDVSDIETPLPIKTLLVEHLDPVAINVHGSDVYVTTRANGIERIDTVDNTYETILSSADAPDIQIVFAKDAQHYLLMKDQTISTHSLIQDDNFTPRSIKGTYIEDSALYDDVIFVIDKGRFKVFNQANESIFEFDLHTSGESNIKVSGAYVLVSSQYKGAFVFDISDINNIFLVGNFNTENELIDAALYENTLSLLDTQNGVQTIHLDQIDDISWASENNIDGNYFSSLRIGDYLYIGNEKQGIQTLDVYDPFNIDWVGNQWSPQFNYRTQYINDLLITSGRHHGVNVMDISSHPEDPDQIIQYQTGDARGVAIHENTMIVANGSLGVSVFDMDAPENIISFETRGYANAVTMHGNYALVANSTVGLSIFDLSEPALPVHIADVDVSGWAYDIVTKGDLAYVAVGHKGVSLVDLTDIHNAGEIELFNPASTKANVRNLHLFENELYLPAGNAGVYVLDVSDPNKPQTSGHYDLPDRSFNLDVDKDFIYSISYYSGLTVADNSRPFIAQDYGAELAGSVLSYDVEWDSIEDLSIDCAVSSGQCYFLEIDPQAKTAVLEWEIGNQSGIQNIAISVGNSRFYRKTFDNIEVN